MYIVNGQTAPFLWSRVFVWGSPEAKLYYVLLYAQSVCVCVIFYFFFVVVLRSVERWRGVWCEFLIVLGAAERSLLHRHRESARGIDILDWSTLARDPLAVVLSAQLWYCGRPIDWFARASGAFCIVDHWMLIVVVDFTLVSTRIYCL